MSTAILKDELAEHEAELQSLKSYVRALREMTSKHGTDEEHFMSDLQEAENNVRFYEAEVERLRKELRASRGERAQDFVEALWPRTMTQGVTILLFSSISFLAGALLAARLQPARRDRRESE